MPAPLYVEVSSLLSTPLTGVGRFTARLVEALARIRPLRLVSLTDCAELRCLNTDRANGVEIGIDAPLPSADGDLEGWTMRLLRLPTRPPDHAGVRSSACVYTMFRPTVRCFGREISILYDFTPILLPWCHEEGTRQLFRSFFASTVTLSDTAIAISGSTKHDASWLCALAPDAVVEAYPGPSLCDRAHACPDAPSRSPHLILVVSTREPRKNAAFVLDWFLNSALLDADTELWWVGPKGWLWDDARIGAAGSGDRRSRFKFLGMVSDARLCELYRRATFTVYPSLYEGFGFPVLDALWHGTPVLSSFNSALKEFARPGVFYFDPYERASLDGAYGELRASPPLTIDAQSLRPTYSWDKLAATVSSLCT